MTYDFGLIYIEKCLGYVVNVVCIGSNYTIVISSFLNSGESIRNVRRNDCPLNVLF